MYSMTGFGAGTARDAMCHYSVEIRSVNHRFFELKLRVPQTLSDPVYEQLIAQAARKRVARGSLLITVTEERAEALTPTVSINQPLAAAYAAAHAQLARTVGAGQETLAGADLLPPAVVQWIAAQPGVLTVSTGGQSAEERFLGLEPALVQALQRLGEARAREGLALAADVTSRTAQLSGWLGEIAQLSSSTPGQKRQRLSDRLARLLEGDQGPIGSIDPARVAQELALLADRIDISEEITRLRVHLGELLRLCSSDGSVGRQLDFLIQEIGREINTMGAKSQSAEIATRIVSMKTELERLREQVQNVE